MRFMSPSRYGKFEILHPLGHGAMGDVFLAQDEVLGRQVALKTIQPELAAIPEMRERFIREAKAAAVLNHPNLVTIFEVGEEGETLYIAMERVEGEELQALLARKGLTSGQILEVAAQVCEGLDHAHSHGILHRDVKPSNVMVCWVDGRPIAKLLDFGVAKLVEGEATQAGQVVGTLAYMAPEYLRDGRALPASDQYSVGVMLFEALSGRRPFGGGSTGALVHSILFEDVLPLVGTGEAGLPQTLRNLVARAMAKEPAQRFSSTRELAQALRAASSGFQDGHSSSDEEATVALLRAGLPTERTPRGSRPPFPWKWMGLPLVGALVAGAGLLAHRLRRAKVVPVAPASDLSRDRLENLVLDEAARILDREPDRALQLVQQVLEATPADQVPDPDAYALKLVILYRRNRLETFGETLAEARFRKVDPQALLRNRTFKAMLVHDHVARRLPDELRGRLEGGQ